MFSGFIHLTPLASIVIMAASFQLTVAAVSLYLHRGRTHGAISFHPLMSQLFRMWIWLTTVGVTTRQWVAVHRKHHAKCDTIEDPHSPQIHGIWKLLTQGTLLYRKAARDTDLVKMYGLGIKEDWMDRNLYVRHRYLGAPFFLIVEMMLFGASTGTMVWLFQITALPFWASGFINGIAHYIGYRNIETRDASRNFLPLGIIFGGEELHNNHHARPGSAKLSIKWWEFDMGWLIIRILSFFRLVKINRV
jgi:stearoyl-CoA desaturase (delta-9 desaturase)